MTFCIDGAIVAALANHNAKMTI